MKIVALAVLAGFGLFGMVPAESPYEPLEIARPAPEVVREGEARELVVDVNRLRAQQGLPLVAIDSLLTRAALAHARDMAHRHFFGHDAPDGTSLPDRLRAVGFAWRVAAENIAVAQDERHANTALVGSPAHRANMLDSRVSKIGIAALGVGVGTALYVEDFAL